MNIEFSIKDKKFRVDLSNPIDISIPIKEGDENPNCYWATDVNFKTIVAGDFIGSVAQGGTVNYKEVTLTPHGNGTHTETYGHLTADKSATIHNLIKGIYCNAELITLIPEHLENGDQLLSIDSFLASRKFETDAVIIRTQPNDDQKKLKKYSGTNPPYLDHKITEYLNKTGVKHLLIDLPSVDREIDGGALLAHRAFWGLPDNVRKDCTITELIYVPDSIPDGLYLINVQTINIDLDASPSRPLLFKVEEC